ncbi:zinc finger protein ZFP2-like isoform X2 [Toxorhynchites rutilus septentrionalis]|uniref:zinc finger protein ZFP2-like isoform X2 n=1 Tax=Toxorhynchites rutilus septentrionalis TaxID=329112 RepID=UPI0024787DF1|nr:zinc finger protein ZFP2-like isoform X2 [Toxorhynchites rutilus septentrionalis]
MAFASNILEQCSFCPDICNEEFHHVLVPSHHEQNLTTILQKLSNCTSQLSSYPTCGKCRQEFIAVHNIPESCFQMLPSTKPTDGIKMDPELMIEDHELPGNGKVFERDPTVGFEPIESGNDIQIKKENEEVFFITEMDEADNMSIIQVAETSTQRKSDLNASREKVLSPSVHHECKTSLTEKGKNPFKCEMCEKSFASNVRLKVHFRIHTGERPYSCPHCQKAFRDPSTLQVHIRIHTGERPYTCPHCPEAFKQTTALRGHIRTHTGERPYICPHCAKAFKKPTALQEHTRTHTEERPFSCPHCPKAFKYTSTLKHHMRKTHAGWLKINKRRESDLDDSQKEDQMRLHTEESSFKCEKCEKTFSSKYGLKIHDRIHTDERPYSCPYCQNAFRYSSTLRDHVRAHTGERPYSCPHCPKAFSRPKTLTHHIQTHTGDRPYSCPHCPKTFIQSTAYKQHIRSHKDERPYACTHCPAAFKNRKTLRVHNRSHTGWLESKKQRISDLDASQKEVHAPSVHHKGEKPFQCELCEKAYTTKSALTLHLRTHTDERPFPCPRCPKAFRQSTALETHYRTHTDERPYRCPHCPKAFKQSSTLQGHIRTHSDERAYSCLQCAKTFKQSTTLQRHIRTHTEKVSYPCPHCSKTFTKSAALHTHIRIHTKDQFEKETDSSGQESQVIKKKEITTC